MGEEVVAEVVEARPVPGAWPEVVDKVVEEGPVPVEVAVVEEEDMLPGEVDFDPLAQADTGLQRHWNKYSPAAQSSLDL